MLGQAICEHLLGATPTTNHAALDSLAETLDVEKESPLCRHRATLADEIIQRPSISDMHQRHHGIDLSFPVLEVELAARVKGLGDVSTPKISLLDGSIAAKHSDAMVDLTIRLMR